MPAGDLHFSRTPHAFACLYALVPLLSLLSCCVLCRRALVLLLLRVHTAEEAGQEKARRRAQLAEEMRKRQKVTPGFHPTLISDLNYA